MDKKPLNTKPIETKTAETKKGESILDAWDFTEFESNRLSISSELKSTLNELGLDWRFINKNEYRRKGNMSSGAWKPYHVTKKTILESFKGVDPEGIIERGDLILAVRPKVLTERRKQQLKQKSDMYKGYNKQKAQEMRQLAQEHGVSDSVKVHEGYEDNN